MKNLLTITILFCLTFNLFGQKDNKTEAYEIASEAIKIMDSGDYKKSIEMLNKSKELDKENYIYPYEIGYAYILLKDYKSAIKTLKGVIKYKNLSPECYTLLGNAYDYNKQPKKAIEIYNEGLITFPKSGRLYFELGIVQEVLKEYNNALSSWENGIAVTPTYPSNYHSASIYYCSYTTEKIWGLMYGELFMNIERGSVKTSEISKLLYETYKAAITIESQTEARVDFSKSMQMSIPKDGEEIKLPFEFPYASMMLLATTSELDKKELGIESFNKIRTLFITNWYENEQNIKYPNILFDWHKTLIELGYFESYNYWLLMKGNQDEFDKWASKNKLKYERFIEWFSENPLEITNEINFHRLQYN